MPKLSRFSHLLRQQRTQLGLTQLQLAHAAGCSISLIRKYESGERYPTHAIATQLTHALGLNKDERTAFIALALQSRDHAPLAPAALPTSTPGWIPTPPTALIGRNTEIQQLVTQLQTMPGRMITLIGPPGVGKSRLAIACGQALRKQFSDGGWFIELAPITNLPDVAIAIARQLNLQVGTDAEQQLIAYLQSRTMLLILDNFEHIVDAAPFVARLLITAPNLVILTTSRVPLRIRAETCVEIQPLPLPRNTYVATVATSPATQLFCERALAINPHFRLDAANAATIAAICVKLDGLPLAIELAAARSDQLTPSTLLEQLKQGFSSLGSSLADLPAHQRTLQATIAWSEQLLPSAARQAFGLLGVFVGSFDEHAVAALGVEQLATLVEHGLVQAIANQRYRLLETLRSYAAEQLQRYPFAIAIRVRYAQYYVEYAEQQAVLLNGPAAPQALQRLDADYANISAALLWSLNSDGGVGAARITVALRRYWLSRGLLHDGRRIEPLLAAVTHHAIPDSLLGRTLLTVGYLASQQGDLASLNLIERGLAITRIHGTPTDVAWGLILRAMPARYPGNLEFCALLLKEAIAITRNLGDQQQLAYALNQLGVAHCENRKYQESLPYFEESIQTAQLVGNQVLIQRYRSDLADAYTFLGDTRRATAIFEAILADPTLDGDLAAAWESQLRLARIELGEHRLVRAKLLLDQASYAVEQIKISYGVPLVMRQYGFLALAEGNLAQADQLLEVCLARTIETFYIEEMAACLIGLATTKLEQNREIAACYCGAYEGLIQRFPVRIDQITHQLHQSVRTTLATVEQELAESACHSVLERITRIDFPHGFIAQTNLRLDLVLAAALRVR